MDKEPWVRWQIIRRKTDYINFCDNLPKYSFDRQSRLIPFRDERALEIKEKYGLKNIYHFSKEFAPEECYENFDIFQNTAPVVRIFPEIILDSIAREHLIEILENGSLGQLVYDEPDDGKFMSRKLNIEASLGFPSAKGFIYFGVSIADEVKWFDIARHITRLIKLARASRNITPKDTRRHPDKYEVYFRIWDMRVIKTPFAEIHNNLRISEDLAKKNFKAAYALIEGKPYDRISCHNMIGDKLTRNAQKSNDPAAWKKALKHGDTYLHEKQSASPGYFDSCPAEDEELLVDFRIDRDKLCGKCPDTVCRNAIMMEDDSAIPCPEFIKLQAEYSEP